MLVQEEDLLRLRHPFSVRPIKRERRTRDIVRKQCHRHLCQLSRVRTGGRMQYSRSTSQRRVDRGRRYGLNPVWV